MKSEQADLVVSAAERFAQVIPLNMQEIFLWYFEQKGVDNPERFLGGVNTGVNIGVNNELVTPSPLEGEGRGEGLINKIPENQLSQMPLNINMLTLLLSLLQQVNKEKGDNAKSEDFINVLENLISQEKEGKNEV